MGGWFAEPAEIVAGGHQSSAKVVLPDAIDHDPRRQRMFGASDPAGKFEPAASLGL